MRRLVKEIVFERSGKTSHRASHFLSISAVGFFLAGTESWGGWGGRGACWPTCREGCEEIKDLIGMWASTLHLGRLFGLTMASEMYKCIFT